MKNIEFIKDLLGIILIILGTLFQLLLLWNELHPKENTNKGLEVASIDDNIAKIILAIIEKLPWLSVVGFGLLVAGIFLIKN
ncbi:hypothetical protein EGI22_12735 [Lacihabitans sp. LS3-19]|uniref:hypothetical protein n=1 Tax=Lacihabitans sp. LS3-19 TaxID=2487335 RepID=UPI0020CD1ECC|nr:hypothetical protein [Lacihabitans sp. LS3-19]MCP9768785.1 hypothetical protein [Lacihabitans sp. LS3-19]